MRRSVPLRVRGVGVSEVEAVDVKALVARHRVDDGERFRLADHDPADTGGMEKRQGKELLERSLEWLDEAQRRLYAQDERALLLIFQGMDASGKDGTIRHVMSGV